MSLLMSSWYCTLRGTCRKLNLEFVLESPRAIILLKGPVCVYAYCIVEWMHLRCTYVATQTILRDNDKSYIYVQFFCRHDACSG